MEVPSLVKEGSPEKRNGDEKLNEEDKAPHVGGGGVNFLLLSYQVA
jgi:hypothetical protein